MCRAPRVQWQKVNVVDQEGYAKAQRRLKTLLRAHPSRLPKGTIPRNGRSDNRLLSYGYRDYSDLFNAR